MIVSLFAGNSTSFNVSSKSGIPALSDVKDLNISDNEKVFIFNGWAFSSSPTLNPFDHPVYDLWLSSCEAI